MHVVATQWPNACALLHLTGAASDPIEPDSTHSIYYASRTFATTLEVQRRHDAHAIPRTAPLSQVLLDCGPRLGAALEEANLAFLCDKMVRVFVPR